MDVIQWVLSSIVVVVVVLIDGLSLQTCYGVKLLDLCRPQPCQRAEDASLDLRHLSILDGVDEGVLRPSSVVLELPGCVFLAKRCDAGSLEYLCIRLLFHR